jgi:hypothetical protein
MSNQKEKIIIKLRIKASTPVEKKISRKRVERDDDQEYINENYKEMNIEDLQYLLKERGLRKEYQKHIAVVQLETYDRNVKSGAKTIGKLAKFEPAMPTLPLGIAFFYDETKPFYGVPMNILTQHLFVYLKYPEKLALAKTSKIFYSPLMKSICLSFQLFLNRIYWEEMKLEGREAYWRHHCKILFRKDVQSIINQGVGITPLAVDFYDKECKHGLRILDNDTLKFLRLICKYGTIDSYRESMKIRSEIYYQEIEQMQDRVQILNKAVTDLGYYSLGNRPKQGPFNVKETTYITIKCNNTTINDKAEDQESKMFYKYLRYGVKFDWSKLNDYIWQMTNIYNLGNRIEEAEQKKLEEEKRKIDLELYGPVRYSSFTLF